MDQQTNPGHMIRALEERGVPLTVRPLPRLSEDDLDFSEREYGFDVNGLLKNSGSVDMEVLVTFLLSRLEVAGRDVNRVEPGWARETWSSMINEILIFGPDIMVFANARELTDRLLTTACRLANPDIKIVMELPNLYPMVKSGDVDVLVGPSWWSVMHWSVHGGEIGRIGSQAVVDENEETAATHSVVINPGVDTNIFSLEGSIICSPLDYTTDNQNRRFTWENFNAMEEKTRCSDTIVTVGFVARISPEKSPGVFVQAASIIIESNSSVRFIVIGGGTFMEEMKEMTRVYEIEEKFTFYGPVYNNKLPSVMRGIDIIINPSQRYESETFCIANIEAMSLGIPIVSFGVGGTGEYLLNGQNSLIAYASPSTDVVTTIAGKVAELVRDRKLRHDIGMEGWRTVREGGYDVESFTGRYLVLYDELVGK